MHFLFVWRKYISSKYLGYVICEQKFSYLEGFLKNNA